MGFCSGHIKVIVIKGWSFYKRGGMAGFQCKPLRLQAHTKALGKRQITVACLSLIITVVHEVNLWC